MQDQSVPVWGGVLRTQDQQMRGFDDPRVNAEDQGLASTVEWQGGTTFLEFAGYYHTFIPQYSVLTNRLNGIKKADKFLWNEDIRREAFIEGGMQAFPNIGVGDPFILTADWSKEKRIR